jgi:hypothetical protein
LIVVIQVSANVNALASNPALAVVSLQSTDLDIGSGYSGTSTTEKSSDGSWCTCATCATHATCLDASGARVSCPCTASYPGTSVFSIAAVSYSPLTPERVALSRDFPMTVVNADIAFSSFQFFVRATDNGGDFGQASIYAFNTGRFVCRLHVHTQISRIRAFIT